MQRSSVLVFALAVSLVGTVARADGRSFADKVEAELRQQGFAQLSVTTTLLGRTRIIALSPTQKREIVVNPHTGEILRDYTTDMLGTNGGREDILAPESGSGSTTSETGASGGDSASGTSAGGSDGGSESGGSDSGNSGSGSGSDSGSGND